MEQYYKKTKAQADLITYFIYAPNQAIDPYVNEQIDGTSLVSNTIYLLLKDRPEIKKVDFSKLTAISKEQIDTKEVPLTPPK